MMVHKIIIFILAFIFVSPAFAAKQDLDEVMVRKDRHGQTHYSGQASPNYFWQPETLCYTDTNYSTEVWRLAWYPAGIDIISKEYSNNAWSHDGSRLGFFDLSSVRTSTDPNQDSVNHRWIVNSDGAKLRKGTGLGRDIGDDAYQWAHTELAYYSFPASSNVPAGTEVDQLYKVTIDSDNFMTNNLLLDVGDGTTKMAIKDCVTSIDSWVVFEDKVAADWPTPNDINSHKVHWIRLSDNSVQSSWGCARGFGPDADPYSNHTQAGETYFRPSSCAILNPNAEKMIGHFSGGSMFWEVSRSGSYADGGPDWEDWDGDSFGTNEEIRAISDDISSSHTPHNPYDNGYAGHISPDRWGKYAQVGYSGECSDGVRWGDSCPGRLVIDLSNDWDNPSWVDEDNSNYVFGYDVYMGGHSSWNGWTDWLIGVSATNSEVLFQNLYNKTTEEGKDNYRAQDTIVSTETPSSIATHYNANPRPSQSPDGTKVTFASVLFHSDYDDDADDDDYLSVLYVVAYYPYPPEITACTATGGTVTVTFDWATDGTTRGYTAREWPVDGEGAPPPPRETEKFRLWRSDDKSTWEEIDTEDADIFTMYDFSDGTWQNGDSWTITDTPDDGTYYYAVTSQEWSGLESRTYSNIFDITVSSGSGTGSEDTGYSATPGADANFFSTAPDPPQSIALVDEGSGLYELTITLPATRTYIRYYNIYALDASAPTAIQQRRIASIPATADYDSNGVIVWKDSFGKDDGTTYYGVTSVSFQGDESAIVPGGGGAVTGTIIPGGCTESEIVDSGKTIVVTFSGTTLVATFGADNQITTDFIDGFDSAQSEAGGWDAKMIAANVLTYEHVARTDANTATVTLPACAAYQITSAETITLTIPASSTEAAETIIASPTFVISAEQIGAESVSAVYDASGPSMTYNAGGISVVAP